MISIVGTTKGAENIVEVQNGLRLFILYCIPAIRTQNVSFIFIRREVTSKQLRKTQNEAADYQRQVGNLNRELRNLQFECVRSTADHSIK